LVLVLLAASGAHAQWIEAVHVPHAAFDTPKSVPSALVHAGKQLDPSQPLHLVVHLHGYMACTAMLLGEGDVRCRPGEPAIEGRGLSRAHEAAAQSTLLIVPQLAFLKRSGKPGCFAKTGCFRAFLEEVLGALPTERLGGKKNLSHVARISLLAHSAGYEAALAILLRGEVNELVSDVVLFDALYGGEQEYLAWIIEHTQARLWSLHLRGGKPAKNSAALHRSAERKLGPQSVAKLDRELDAARLAGKRIVIARLPGAHREMPERYLAAVLRALRATR
jgi:hypothetical protein